MKGYLLSFRPTNYLMVKIFITKVALDILYFAHNFTLKIYRDGEMGSTLLAIVFRDAIKVIQQ
jgi:hypothetical protein